jgi:hypothetical protein
VVENLAAKMKHTEQAIQIQVVNRLRLQYPHALFTTAAAAGESLGRNPLERFKKGHRVKAMGYMAGSPDLMFFEPRLVWHGLFIEMKAKGGRLTPEQKTFLEALDARHYKTAVCFSVEEAWATITDYMDTSQ